MKKIYTLLLACAAFSRLDAQVGVTVLEPSTLAGGLESTFADTTDWGVPDMRQLAHAVTDTIAFAYDGSDADSLCCEAVINRAQIEGKIAVFYRGTCNFSLKALNCQDSGAVAILIINNIPGSPIPMGAGDYGADVHIPVFMITQDGGAAVRAAFDAGDTIVAYLGNLTGYFQYDLGFQKADILMPQSACAPALLCQNETEYSPVLGAWMRNYGAQPQTDATLTIDVSLNGSSIWNQVSDPQSIPSGDSVFVQLEAFTQPTYSGFYTITYTLNSPAAEQYVLDNTFVTTLYIGDYYSYAPFNVAANKPITTGGTAFQAPAGDFTWCTAFVNPHASRVAASGMYIAALRNAPSSMDGELIDIAAYEWNDVFTGINDGGFGFTDLNNVANGEVIIDQDTTSWSGYVPFTSPVVLTDNQRYLFCLTTTNTDASTGVFLGSNTTIDYNTNENTDDQPTTPIENGTTWNRGFAATASSAGVQMVDANTIGIAEHQETTGTPYPNPTNDLLRIPMKGRTGSATLDIADMHGAKISSQRVRVDGGLVEAHIAGVASGTYMVTMTFDNGSKTTFRVVVNK